MPIKHLNYLDGWRGLAVGSLLLGHFFPVPGINFGTVGVNLFFVLSGLLMGRLLFVQNVPLTVFYARRISRILPATLFFLTAVTLLYSIIDKPIEWSEVVAAALFVNNYFPGNLGHSAMPFGHVWSLSVEEHSYILLSVLALAARRKWIAPLFAIGAASALSAMACLHYFVQHNGNMTGLWIRSEVSAFGILISATFLLHFPNLLPRLPRVTCPALFMLGLAMHWWSIPDPVRIIVGVGSLALAVNLLPQAPKLIQSALSFKPLRQLGIWSFSIYLWQQPFYLLVRRDGMSPWPGLALAFIVGLASFYLIENPARRWLNKRWGGERLSRPLYTPAQGAK